MAVTRIAINGFGRIGRNAFKIANERSDLEIVAINDLTDTKTLAYLLKHDSNYGEYGRQVDFTENELIIEGKSVKVLAEKDPENLPWRDLNIDVVIESTGFFTDKDGASKHLTAGAKRVVISGPTKSEGVDTIVLGTNDDKVKNATPIKKEKSELCQPICRGFANFRRLLP
jgi:glyceraldehyde 3-phosphate dehydrogenase